MKRVENPALFDELLSGAKSRCVSRAPVSNCYFLAEEINRLCSSRVLYYESYEGGVLFFHFRGRDVRLVAVCDPDIPIDGGVFGKFDKPVRCVFPSRGTRFAPGVDGLILRLRETGFVHEATARLLVFSPTEEQRDAILAYTHNAFVVGVAGVHHAGEILSLWEENFDPGANGIPTKAELIPLLAQGRVLYAATAEGCLAGALLTEFSTSKACVWHVAAKASMRGKGAGRAMMTAYHRMGLDMRVRTFRLWVSDKDTGAEAFHGKLGYSPVGKASETYIYNCMEK